MMLPIEFNRLAIRYETHTNAGLQLKAVMNEARMPRIIGSKLHSLSRSGLGSIPGINVPATAPTLPKVRYKL